MMNLDQSKAFKMPGEMAALRDYIMAKDEIQYQDLAETTVVLNVTHSNLSRRLQELRLDLHMTIQEVKEKIYRHCGTKPDFQQLILKGGPHQDIQLNEEWRKLGFYPIQHGMTIHIIDLDPFSLAKGGGLDDVSLVKKYMISEEDYDKREKTVRAYKRDQLAKDPTWKPPILPGSSKASKPSSSNSSSSNNADVPGPDSIKGMEVGNRCEVQPGGRRGTVAYLGEVEELCAGYWVGVKFDEPVGKGDGCIKGKTYFNCGSKYGGFIRPHNVTVGDFPEEDPFADSDEDEM